MLWYCNGTLYKSGCSIGTWINAVKKTTNVAPVIVNAKIVVPKQKIEFLSFFFVFRLEVFVLQGIRRKLQAASVNLTARSGAQLHDV